MRTVLKVLGPLLCLGVVSMSSAVAEAPFSFDTTPGKLPKTVVPRLYRIRLHPDTTALTTTGKVEVELDVLKPVTEVVFNALELEISAASLDGTAAASLVPHPESQTVTVTSGRVLEPGKHKLQVDFRGEDWPATRGSVRREIPGRRRRKADAGFADGTHRRASGVSLLG